MRILHTGDFHAGRSLAGVSRTPEIRAALHEIANLAESEKVDAVLVAGDLFDSAHPKADAEQAVFEFYLSLKEKGIPSVSIAGNHDSSRRLASISGLLGWVGAQMVSDFNPQQPLAGVRSIMTKGGTELKVAALPFLSERLMIKGADLAGADVAQWRMKFQEGMQFFMRLITSGFSADAVNVLMMHTTVQGAINSGSESSFKFDMENAYVIPVSNLPTSAQYVALGHIHKAQQLCDSPLAYYAGSPIQLDFGEAGDEKSVRLVELESGRPAKVHKIPLSSGTPLKQVRVNLEHLDRELVSLEGFKGHLKVVVRVPGGAAVAGLRDRILTALPQTLKVELERVEEAFMPSQVERKNLSSLELFERYYHEKRSGDLPENVRKAFLEADLAVREGD
jgi:DNA repair protein SbcD/Mre11